ncbi:hypothetical protein POTOM_042418 [Populus tomentosa]|uniref:Uncharacterized protein n=1 Tax=Populus tomentosa TaxID=118781 RepID=A0A8X7YNK7_POPTO|nr:hypothetical protein POTOM_042418 [Populus tomentosa]
MIRWMQKAVEPVSYEEHRQVLEERDSLKDQLSQANRKIGEEVIKHFEQYIESKDNADYGVWGIVLAPMQGTDGETILLI